MRESQTTEAWPPRIMGVESNYKLLGDATNWGHFQTLDKVGPQAVNLTGEEGALYGVPVVVSPYVPETCSNASVDDGLGTDRPFILANRRAYGLATQTGPTIETVWDPESLQYKVIGYQRVDFRPWFNWVPRLGLPSDVPADGNSVGRMLGCCVLLGVAVGCSGAGTTTMLAAWLALVTAYLGLVRLEGGTNALEPGLVAISASLPVSIVLPVLEKTLWCALW